MQFWRTQTYKKQAKRLGLSENVLKAIEDEVAQNPDAGDVVPGLKGARRFVLLLGTKANAVAAERSMLFCYQRIPRT
jgi:hypothetical protein